MKREDPQTKCPYCHKAKKIIRIASGIWECTKCRSKFAGRAYAIGQKKTAVEETVLEEAPMEEEPKEAKKEDEA
jgi:ribosomal protein L37AE/L43A